jgi:two-component system sensor histidine kinase CreC
VSTTSRILIAFLLILGTGLFFFVRAVSNRVLREYLEAVEGPMVDAANIIASSIEQTADAKGNLDLSAWRRAMTAVQQREFQAQIYNVTKTSVNMNFYVTDGRGIVLFDSNHGEAEGADYRSKKDVGLTLAGEYGARATRADPKESMSATLFVAAPIRVQTQIVGVVTVSKPERSLFAFIEQTREQIRWLGLVLYLLIVLGAYAVISVLSRPIRRLTEYAYAVARGERTVAPMHGAPEIAALGRAFEEMRDALEDRKYVETYVQTLTHEMKSPLAAIRGAAELLEDEAMPAGQRNKFLANIQAESRRLANQVDRLLALANIESRKRPENLEPASLAELAESVCQGMRPAAEARGIALVFRSEEKPTVVAETFLIEIAIANLIQNAIDFSPRGGEVRVTVKSEGGAWAEIRVEDDGPGIPEYALDRLFERFYSLQRPESGRKSSGLGLCFVREAAQLHRGEATVVNRQEGRGAVATLRLPRDAG